MYIRGALGCIVVTDILRPETMDEMALDWKSIVDTQADPLIDGKTIPILLFQNKVDLIENKTVVEDRQGYLKEFTKKNGFDMGFLTSAKDNVNLTEAFNSLTQLIITRHLSKTDMNNGGFDQNKQGRKSVALKNKNEEKNKGSGSGCC